MPNAGSEPGPEDSGRRGAAASSGAAFGRDRSGLAYLIWIGLPVEPSIRASGQALAQRAATEPDRQSEVFVAA